MKRALMGHAESNPINAWFQVTVITMEIKNILRGQIDYKNSFLDIRGISFTSITLIEFFFNVFLSRFVDHLRIPLVALYRWKEDRPR